MRATRSTHPILTRRRSVLLQTPILPHLVKEFPVFHKSQKFIYVPLIPVMSHINPGQAPTLFLVEPF